MAVREAMQCSQVWGGNQPIDAEVGLGGLRVYVSSEPYGAGGVAAPSGGDVYYLSSCAAGRIARVLLADVSGHGVEVAGIARSLRDLMRRHMNSLDQSSLVSRLNREFGGLASAGCFATSVVLSVWLPTREVEVCSAGHPRALWFNAAAGVWTAIDPGGLSPRPDDEPANLPLGIVDPASYDQASLRLGAGDLLLLYSDAVIEARTPAGRFLGESGLLAMVRGLDVGRAERFVPELLARVSAWRGGAAADDDCTVILLHQAEAAPWVGVKGAVAWMARLAMGAQRRVCGGRGGRITTRPVVG